MLDSENVLFDDAPVNIPGLIRLLQRRSTPELRGDCVDVIADIRSSAA